VLGLRIVKTKWSTTEEVTRRMQRIRSRHTALEGAMRKLLRRAGIKFRSQPGQFGKPDFWIVGTKILVFCDSSFWHGRKYKPSQFSRNQQLWAMKLTKTIHRDKIVTRRLRRAGWKVLRFWDSQIAAESEEALRRIKFAIFQGR